MTRWIAVLVGLLIGPLGAQDKIVKVDGSTLPPPGGRPIEVLSENIREVRYRLQGLSTPLKLPAGDVKEIIYGRAPSAYREGEQALRDGYYLDAAEAFAEALKQARGYRWVREYALFKMGVAYAAAGKHAEAVRAYRDLLKAAPETRFLPDARRGIVQAFFASRGAQAAKEIEAQLAELERDIRRYHLPKRWTYEVRYWRLRLEAARGRDVAAQAEALARDAASESRDVADRARVLVGRSLLATNLERARDYFRQVLRSAPKNAYGVRAAAFYGLGLCIFRSSTEKDTASYKRAREYFLRAVVLGDEHPGAVDAEVFADALIHAAKCFKILRKENKINLRHADRLLKAVEERFPGTIYAKRAAEERRRS